MMKYSLFLLFIALSVFTKMEARSLDSLESHMARIMHLINEAPSDVERSIASTEMSDLLIEAFKNTDAFEYSFDQVFRVVSITSPDGAFRLFNWSQENVAGTSYQYFGFLLFPNKGKYVELKDVEALGHDDVLKKYTDENWYGALYYEIFPVKANKETYYTIMGWDGNNQLSSKKVLDVMSIDKKRNVTFGLPIYQFEDTWVSRRIFEYAKEVSMTLRYLSAKDAIVFDALEPSRGGLEGQYAFYGPSLSHNAYQLSKEGNWVLIENFNMARPKGTEEGAQFNFPDKVDPKKIRSKVNPLTGK